MSINRAFRFDTVERAPRSLQKALEYVRRLDESSVYNSLDEAHESFEKGDNFAFYAVSPGLEMLHIGEFDGGLGEKGLEQNEDYFRVELSIVMDLDSRAIELYDGNYRPEIGGKELNLEETKFDNSIRSFDSEVFKQAYDAAREAGMWEWEEDF